MLYHQRGATVCGNGLIVPLEGVDQAVLAAVERDVLNVDVLEMALYKAMATIESPAEKGWQGLLRQDIGQARQALSSLLAGRLVFTPRECPDGRFYEFEGPGTVSKLIAGFALPRGLVTR